MPGYGQQPALALPDTRTTLPNHGGVPESGQVDYQVLMTSLSQVVKKQYLGRTPLFPNTRRRT